MFNSIILASVNNFTQGSLDKNGKQPVILNVVAGKCPNRNVISGTVAESIGIEVGKTYLLSVREVESDATYGRRFNYQKLDTVEGIDIINAVNSMEKAHVFDVAEAPTDRSVMQQEGTKFTKDNIVS